MPATTVFHPLPTGGATLCGDDGMRELRDYLGDSVRRMRRANFPPERVVIEVKALSSHLDQPPAIGRPSDAGFLRAKELRDWMVTCAIEDYYANDAEAKG